MTINTDAVQALVEFAATELQAELGDDPASHWDFQTGWEQIEDLVSMLPYIVARAEASLTERPEHELVLRRYAGAARALLQALSSMQEAQNQVEATADLGLKPEHLGTIAFTKDTEMVVIQTDG